MHKKAMLIKRRPQFLLDEIGYPLEHHTWTTMQTINNYKTRILLEGKNHANH